MNNTTTTKPLWNFQLLLLHVSVQTGSPQQCWLKKTRACAWAPAERAESSQDPEGTPTSSHCRGSSTTGVTWGSSLSHTQWIPQGACGQLQKEHEMQVDPALHSPRHSRGLPCNSSFLSESLTWALPSWAITHVHQGDFDTADADGLALLYPHQHLGFYVTAWRYCPSAWSLKPCRCFPCSLCFSPQLTFLIRCATHGPALPCLLCFTHPAHSSTKHNGLCTSTNPPTQPVLHSLVFIQGSHGPFILSCVLAKDKQSYSQRQRSHKVRSERQNRQNFKGLSLKSCITHSPFIMTAFNWTISSEFSLNFNFHHQMSMILDILWLDESFFLSFPPHGHYHENYSEMHSSYSDNNVYIRF